MLDGRTAFVTGASRGIGRVVVEQLEAAGARVVAVARSIAEERTATRLALRCDVTSEVQVAEVVETALAAFGPPEIVVNNAGVFLLKPFAETTRDEFEHQMAVNLIAPFLVLRALLPHLARDPRTHIVTIGSVADHRPYPGNAAYGASKYGVRGLHEVVAAELRGTGIRTTLISPGPTDTKLWEDLSVEGVEQRPAKSSMLSPHDVAQAVLYAVTQPPRVNVEWICLMPTE